MVVPETTTTWTRSLAKTAPRRSGKSTTPGLTTNAERSKLIWLDSGRLAVRGDLLFFSWATGRIVVCWFITTITIWYKIVYMRVWPWEFTVYPAVVTILKGIVMMNPVEFSGHLVGWTHLKPELHRMACPHRERNTKIIYVNPVVAYLFFITRLLSFL
jgi:hypothetical protein